MTAHDERSLVLLSALTQTSLRLEASPPLSLSAKGEKVKPDVVLRDVMRGRTTPNRALIDARAEPAPQVGLARLAVHLHRAQFSTQAQRDVELRLARHVETRATRPSARTRQTPVSIAARARPPACVLAAPSSLVYVLFVLSCAAPRHDAHRPSATTPASAQAARRERRTPSRTMSSDEREVFLNEQNTSSGHRGVQAYAATAQRQPDRRHRHQNRPPSTRIPAGWRETTGCAGGPGRRQRRDGKVAGILIGAVES
jgi:hypothetical protein